MIDLFSTVGRGCVFIAGVDCFSLGMIRFSAMFIDRDALWALSDDYVRSILAARARDQGVKIGGLPPPELASGLRKQIRMTRLTKLP